MPWKNMADTAWVKVWGACGFVDRLVAAPGLKLDERGTAECAERLDAANSGHSESSCELGAARTDFGNTTWTFSPPGSRCAAESSLWRACARGRSHQRGVRAPGRGV